MPIWLKLCVCQKEKSAFHASGAMAATHEDLLSLREEVRGEFQRIVALLEAEVTKLQAKLNRRCVLA